MTFFMTSSCPALFSDALLLKQMPKKQNRFVLLLKKKIVSQTKTNQINLVFHDEN